MKKYQIIDDDEYQQMLMCIDNDRRYLSMSNYRPGVGCISMYVDGLQVIYITQAEVAVHQVECDSCGGTTLPGICDYCGGEL